MPTYTFYIYSNAALVYNGGTNAFDLDPTYDSTQDRYRIEVNDDDNVMNSGSDFNQIATVYDMDDNVVDSGTIYVPMYAMLGDGSGGSLYIDRVEVNGTHYGYVSDMVLTPGNSYPYLGGGTFEEDHTYYQTYSTACFAPGTTILTVEGDVAVEDLRRGDLVLTWDHGAEPLRWAGRWSSTGEAEHLGQSNWPVTIRGGGAICGTPTRPLVLSAQHRVMLRGPWCELTCGEAEVLAPAHGIADPEVPAGELAWHHLLFDRHEIVRANGIWVESLFAGGDLFAELPVASALSAIAALGPSTSRQGAARPFIRKHEARLITQRSRAPLAKAQEPGRGPKTGPLVSEHDTG